MLSLNASCKFFNRCNTTKSVLASYSIKKIIFPIAVFAVKQKLNDQVSDTYSQNRNQGNLENFADTVFKTEVLPEYIFNKTDVEISSNDTAENTSEIDNTVKSKENLSFSEVDCDLTSYCLEDHIYCADDDFALAYFDSNYQCVRVNMPISCISDQCASIPECQNIDLETSGCIVDPDLNLTDEVKTLSETEVNFFSKIYNCNTSVAKKIFDEDSNSILDSPISLAGDSNTVNMKIGNSANGNRLVTSPYKNIFIDQDDSLNKQMQTSTITTTTDKTQDEQACNVENKNNYPEKTCKLFGFFEAKNFTDLFGQCMFSDDNVYGCYACSKNDDIDVDKVNQDQKQIQSTACQDFVENPKTINEKNNEMLNSTTVEHEIIDISSDNDDSYFNAIQSLTF